jgi:hypothetical protein
LRRFRVLCASAPLRRSAAVRSGTALLRLFPALLLRRGAACLSGGAGRRERFTDDCHHLSDAAVAFGAVDGSHCLCLVLLCCTRGLEHAAERLEAP